MRLQHDSIGCRYEYDPLDRLVGLKPLAKEGCQRFYCNGRLATEIQGLSHSSIVQQGDQLLAQQLRQGKSVETDLLVTDRLRSVVCIMGKYLQRPITYTPYGHAPPESGLTSMLGFNGERPDLLTGCYLLGNGYRAFNPVLMRFNSPDSLSPFDKGGLNSYVYCLGDPVNMSDPAGNVAWFNLTTSQVNVLSAAARAAGKSPQGFFPGVKFSDRGVSGNLDLGQKTKLSQWRGGVGDSINYKDSVRGPKKLSILSWEVIHEYAHALEMPPGLRKFMEGVSPSNRYTLEEFSKLRKFAGDIPELPDKFASFNKQHKRRVKAHENIVRLANYAKQIRTSFSPSEISNLRYGMNHSAGMAISEDGRNIWHYPD